MVEVLQQLVNVLIGGQECQSVELLHHELLRDHIVGTARRDLNESKVSFVSRRYMRGKNGKDSLMVCLSRIAIFQNNVIKAYRSVLLIRIGKQIVKIIYI